MRLLRPTRALRSNNATVPGTLLDIGIGMITHISVVGLSGPLGRTPTTLRPATLRGRLLAMQEARGLEIGGPGPWSANGTIESVNIDHLTLSQVGKTPALIVPLASIGFVLRSQVRTRRDRAAQR